MTDTTDLDPIEPLTDVENAPPVRNNEQLRRRWRSILGPDGFGQDTLWVTWFDADGNQAPAVMPIDDIPDDLDPQKLDGLIMVLDSVADFGATSAALALARPGPAQVSEVDRRRVRSLLTAIDRARDDGRLRVSCWPIQLATRNCVRTLGPEDLT